MSTTFLSRLLHPRLHPHLRPVYRHLSTTSTPAPTPLMRQIHRQIRHSSPLTVAEYMSLCLTHPQHGYYTTRPQIFGKSGDFVTAAHISPVFSELLAVFITNFIQTNKYTNYNLAELGPGDGLMMSIILKALSRFGTTPQNVLLLEASPQLQSIQKNNIDHPSIAYHSTLSSLLSEEHPTIFLLHEFLDALPVHILHQTPNSWREQLIDISPPDDLRHVLSPNPTPVCHIPSTLPPSPPILEVSPQAISTVQRLAQHIKSHTGAAIIIDYGSDNIPTPTLRALSKHSTADILARPGEHDVTADVNFAHLRHGLEHVTWHGPVGQGKFLLRLGAAERFRRLGRQIVSGTGDVDAKLEALQADYDRLVVQMGDVYKVAVVTGEGEQVYGLS